MCGHHCIQCSLRNWRLNPPNTCLLWHIVGTHCLLLLDSSQCNFRFSFLFCQQAVLTPLISSASVTTQQIRGRQMCLTGFVTQRLTTFWRQMGTLNRFSNWRCSLWIIFFHRWCQKYGEPCLVQMPIGSFWTKPLEVGITHCSTFEEARLPHSFLFAVRILLCIYHGSPSVASTPGPVVTT
jgi:hypothetical protein